MLNNFKNECVFTSSLFKKLNFLNVCFNSAILISGRGRDLQSLQLQSMQMAAANRTGFDGLHVESGIRDVGGWRGGL